MIAEFMKKFFRNIKNVEEVIDFTDPITTKNTTTTESTTKRDIVQEFAIIQQQLEAQRQMNELKALEAQLMGVIV